MELKLPVVEKVSVGKAAAPVHEAAPGPTLEGPKAPPGSPRAKLEHIAEGNIAEAFAAPQENPLPSREVTQQLLTEANQALLDAQDARLLFSAIATQAADTPLGNQMRIDTLRMLGDFAPMQEKIKALNLPADDPTNNALIQTIQQYNEKYPTNAVPLENLTALTLADLLQTDTKLAGAVWEGITGQAGLTGFHLEPKRILQIAELDITQKNMENAKALFTPMQEWKQPPASFMEKFTPTLMIGAMGIMFITQMATGEQQSGH